MSKFSEKVTQDFLNRLQSQFNVSPDEASDKQIYLALSSVITELMKAKRQKFMNHVNSTGQKQVFYLSMEFLMGRSLKTSLYNLELADDFEKFLKKFDINLDRVYDYEPDAGLGNGGLGRLAACYLDGLATASSSRSLKKAGRQSFRITGCRAARSGSTRDRSRRLRFTLRAISKNTGISSITMFPMSITAPSPRSPMICMSPATTATRSPF